MATLRASQWSYAQYAMFRRLLGAYLLAHCLALIPKGASFSRAAGSGVAALEPLLDRVPSVLDYYAEPWAVQVLIAVAVLASVLLTLGRADRGAAVVLGYVLACLYARNPVAANASLPIVGCLLLMHAALPRPDAGALARLAAWSVPRPYLAAAWIVLAWSYSYGGWVKLRSPAWLGGDAVRIALEGSTAGARWLDAWTSTWPAWMLEGLTWAILYAELLFAPLALLPRLRPWLWGIMLGGQIGSAALLGFADGTIPMSLMHLFTVEQRWLSRFENKVPATVYYDGHCALCHRLVRFALVEDRRRRLTFAPLQSDTAVAYLGDDRYRRRADTVVVRTADGETHERSDAAIEVLCRLGGWWAVLGAAAALAPQPLRDRVYDLVGASRSRFGRTRGLCPGVPAEFAARFLGSSGGGVDRDTAC